MRVSVELVPRSEDALFDDVAVVQKVLPQVGLLNIPDLIRFDLRSDDAAAQVNRRSGMDVIPHIRAIDIAPGAPLPGADRPELKSVLVVAGDPLPAGSDRENSGMCSKAPQNTSPMIFWINCTACGLFRNVAMSRCRRLMPQTFWFRSRPTNQRNSRL